MLLENLQASSFETQLRLAEFTFLEGTRLISQMKLFSKKKNPFQLRDSIKQVHKSNKNAGKMPVSYVQHPLLKSHMTLALHHFDNSLYLLINLHQTRQIMCKSQNAYKKCNPSERKSMNCKVSYTIDLWLQNSKANLCTNLWAHVSKIGKSLTIKSAFRLSMSTADCTKAKAIGTHRSIVSSSRKRQAMAQSLPCHNSSHLA